MFVVVEIGGQQHRIHLKDRIIVPKLNEKIGSTITIDRVLLLVQEHGLRIGDPIVKDTSVQAEVIGHVQDKKLVVFKKKKRKGYRVRRGHRQEFTELEITAIG